MVTGGAGFIGAHVVRRLLASGTPVRVLDSFLYGAHGLDGVQGHPLLRTMEGDIRDPDAVDEAVRGATHVIALAALVGDAACEIDPEQTWKVNVDATDLLADACVRFGVRRLVFASTCSVYGAQGLEVLNEDAPTNPVSLYGRARLESERRLLDRAGLKVTILRLGTVFGASPRLRLDLLVNTLTAHAFFRGKISVCGGGQWRPNIHVRDAAEAFVVAAAADGPWTDGMVLNVGHAALNYTVLDIAEIVRRLVPGTSIDVREDLRDPRNYRVSFDRIQSILGFYARRSLEDGVQELLEVFKRGGIDPTAERFSNLLHLQAHGLRTGDPLTPACR